MSIGLVDRIGSSTEAEATERKRTPPEPAHPTAMAEMQTLLAAWRAAERTLAACPLGDPAWTAVNATSAELRVTYQRLFEARCPRHPVVSDLERVRIAWDVASILDPGVAVHGG